LWKRQAARIEHDDLGLGLGIYCTRVYGTLTGLVWQGSDGVIIFSMRQLAAILGLAGVLYSSRKVELPGRVRDIRGGFALHLLALMYMNHVAVCSEPLLRYMYSRSGVRAAVQGQQTLRCVRDSNDAYASCDGESIAGPHCHEEKPGDIRIDTYRAVKYLT